MFVEINIPHLLQPGEDKGGKGYLVNQLEENFKDSLLRGNTT